MWKINLSEKCERRLKEYSKKHRNEFVAVSDNFVSYYKTLESGIKPPLITGGFIHKEPKGIIAIDQKGGKGKLKQTRLYIYPNDMTNTLHLITLGDKHSQIEDIKDSVEFITSIRV